MSIAFLQRASRHPHLLKSIPRSLVVPVVEFDDYDTRRIHCTANDTQHLVPCRRNDIQKRSYHATEQKPILPLLAIGAVGIGIYSYRALKQIDQDWEEYYEKLDEYRRVTGLDPEASTDVSNGDASSDKTANGADKISSLFTGGTLAIDLGTSKLKLAHLPSLNKMPSAKPTVAVDRDGARSTPSLIWMSSDNNDLLVGKMAESRMYDLKGGQVFHPREILNSSEDVSKAMQQSIRTAASNALDQVLGGQTSSTSSSPLFVVDQSMAHSGSYNVRPVFTYPNEEFLSRYKHVIQSLTSPEGIATFVPESVAIVSGAKYYNILPSTNDGPVLVLDVGGSTTNLSVVSNEDEVVFSSSVPLGGDTFVDLLTVHLIHNFYGETATSNNANNVDTKPILNDPTALQRLHEASNTALYELSNKSRSQINVPYLSIDLQTKQPKHLEMGVPRSIVDKEVETFVRERLVDYLLENGSALSSHIPKPTDMASLFSSTLASAMEHTSQTPFSLRAVVLVGGGARIPLIRDAVKCGVGQVGGDMFLERLIVPKGEMVEELTVLGAAVWCGSKK